MDSNDSTVGQCFVAYGRKGLDTSVREIYRIVRATTPKGLYDCVVLREYSNHGGYRIDHGGEVIHIHELSRMERVSQDEYGARFYRAIQWLTEKHQEAK